MIYNFGGFLVREYSIRKRPTLRKSANVLLATPFSRAGWNR